MFDKAKDMASNVGGGDIAKYQEYLQGMKFPASKDEVASQLQQKGADSGMVDKVKNAAMDRFNGPDDVMGALQ